MRVNFIVCGAQKGGTTALDRYLREHPQVCMAEIKEVHYFDSEAAVRKGQKNGHADYHGMFLPKPQHKAIGEATPSYMYWHESARRMWRYNPKLRLIAVLRNPIDRAFSHWNMEHNRLGDTLPFWEAIQTEAERCRAALPHQHKIFSYVDRGFYTEQIRRLWRFFPREQLLILKSEDLRNHPQESLAQVCRHIGVDVVEAVEAKDVHSRRYDTTMTQQERDHLRNVYEFEIRALERMLGWDCSSWLADKPAKAEGAGT